MGEVEPTSNNLVLHLDHSDLFQIFMKGAGKGMGLPGELFKVWMTQRLILHLLEQCSPTNSYIPPAHGSPLVVTDVDNIVY